MLIKREVKNRSNDLHVAYRPCTLGELLGNEANKRILSNYLDTHTLPHTLLFSGDAGCGKTTAARIIALSLNCESVDVSTSKPCLNCYSCKSILAGSNMDVVEHNVGKEGGKADINEIIDNLPFAPFSSRNKVIIFDEAHKLTDAAKDLLLKDAEDGFSHVYFIFCTNQPEALLSKKASGGNAFLGRCQRLNFAPLSHNEAYDMLINVLEFEGREYDKKIVELIVEETKGIPREALLRTSAIAAEGSWTEEAARVILGGIANEDAPMLIDLCKALLAAKWTEACKLFSEATKHYTVEGIRIVVLGYFIGCLKKCRKFSEARKFSAAIDHIVDPIYVQGKPAENIFYHKMFKVVDVIKNYKEN